MNILTRIGAGLLTAPLVIILALGVMVAILLYWVCWLALFAFTGRKG